MYLPRLHRSIGRLTALVANALLFTVGSSAHGQTIAIDVSATAQEIIGFGAQVWAGDSRGYAAVDRIGGRIARAQFGTNYFEYPTQPPTDSNNVVGDNFAAMKSHVAAYFNGVNGNLPWRLPNAVGMQNWATNSNVDLILNEFQIAYGFLNAQRTAMPADKVDDFATFWAAAISYLDDNGVRPKYVELANEPNGTWNGRISGPNFNQLVKQTRSVLDAQGFDDVGILGPGLNVLGNTAWIDALDNDAVAALAGWSTHTWDDDEGIDSRAQTFLDAVAAKDADKPIFITEYATDLREFNGQSYGDPDTGGDAADQPEFAVQVFKNTLSLANHGAGAFLYWEAADQPWNTIRWGLTRLDNTTRPVDRALAMISESLPEGAVALDANWDDGPLTVSAFVDGQTLVVAAANTTGSSETSTIRLDALPAGIEFVGGSQFLNDEVIDISVVLDGDEFLLTLPPVSAQVLEFKLTATPGDYNADGLVDAADYQVWLDAFGSTTSLSADGSGNGRVDAADYSLWRDALVAESNTTGVPEPAAVTLLLPLVLASPSRAVRD